MNLENYEKIGEALDSNSSNMSSNIFSTIDYFSQLLEYTRSTGKIVDMLTKVSVFKYLFKTITLTTLSRILRSLCQLSWLGLKTTRPSP